jgi:predicted nucleic acid-binding Zn ribbon protein
MSGVSPPEDVPADAAAPAPEELAADAAAPPPEELAADAAAKALRRATRSTRPEAPRSRKRPATQPGSDPELVGATIDRLLRDRGWTGQAAVATVMAEWADIVGRDLAAHVVPVSFDEGTLVVRAESTAWATQVRLLLPQLDEAVSARVGKGVVRAITVVGPATPTWAAGPRRVKGRGPRDTYG